MPSKDDYISDFSAPKPKELERVRPPPSRCTRTRVPVPVLTSAVFRKVDDLVWIRTV